MKAYREIKACIALNTVPESGAPGPVELDSEDASGFGVYWPSRDPISSSPGQEVTERYLLQDVQLLNHKRGRVPRRGEKSIQCIATRLSAQQTCSLCR